MDGPGAAPARVLAEIRNAVVGRAREGEVVVAALAAGRHVVVEGPPGTGKSTMLRALAEAAGVELFFVEGNAELTPSRLVGHHDPSRVLSEDYRPENFVEGPLPKAMRAGGLLYLEELNRVPEETLNVVLTALADRELHIPRFGRVDAADGFRLVAAMNPFDAVGTARVSQAVYDRTCRVVMGYQGEEEEREIVVRRAPGASAFLVKVAVDCVRESRIHPDLRHGASVRGAIDLVLVAGELARLREQPQPTSSTGLDAALAALSGKVTVDEGSGRTAEDIVTELWTEALGKG